MQASNDSRAMTHISTLGDNMNTLSNHNLVSVSPVSAARDIVRLVIAAVLAGAGFSILMALAVLSLTVIAPPVQASGAPAITSSGSADVARTSDRQPAAPTGTTFIGDAAAAQPVAAAVPAISSEDAPAQLSLLKWGSVALALALLASVAVVIARARSRQ